jgi:hypothetical protein
LAKETSDSISEESSDVGSPAGSVGEERDDSEGEEQEDSGSEEQEDSGSEDSSPPLPPPKRVKQAIFGSDEGIIEKTSNKCERSQCGATN